MLEAGPCRRFRAGAGAGDGGLDSVSCIRQPVPPHSRQGGGGLASISGKIAPYQPSVVNQQPACLAPSHPVLSVGVVRWHLTAHAADAVVHTSTCIAGSQPCMHYL